MSDFSGPGAEFAVGEMYGVRSWIPERGRLTAYTNDYVYSNGVNIAECSKDHSLNISTTVQAYKLGVISSFEYGRRMAELSMHRHDLYRCTCGFYAYYDESQHAAPRTIEGIIKAYGKVCIGPKGFRAEKAEIVALSLGGNPSNKPNPRISFKAAGMRTARIEQALVAWVIAVDIALIFMMPTFSQRIAPAIGVLIFLPMFIASCWRPRKHCRLKQVDLHRPFCKCTAYTPLNDKFFGAESVAKIAKRYPDAEVFESYDEMMAAYAERLDQSRKTANAKVKGKDGHG